MTSASKAATQNAAALAQPDSVELPDDPRLKQAVQDFLDQLEAGRRPDRQEFLRRYPDLATPLGQCLDGLELVHRAGLREKRPTAVPPVGLGDVASATPLGDYQIIREIGRGGMGIVYEAVQLSLGRRVAVKVLPFAATFDAKHLQRFHNEAQSAAQLHHTNIVPIYGVGSERGVHFYAMQLIEGHSLAEIIRQVRHQTGRPEIERTLVSQTSQSREVGPDEPTGPLQAPAGRLEQEERAETVSQMSMALSTYRSKKQTEYFRTAARLILQAAEALDHAHQFGIVHRDVKPANLLVDLHGRLWITDFGLAQFRTDASLTQTGDVLGTLRYMSPEQASGQRVLLDHRTDVYSLGATLYELLTLEPIFPGRSSQELLHQIVHDEPRGPRLLEKTVPVELETIVLKAVSKSPADRYGSAKEFAADLKRYLQDKPVLARRPSLLDRGRKWSRRHPSVIAAGLLLLLVCIAALLINNWMIAKEQAETAKRASEAEARFRLARGAVDEMIRLANAEPADPRSQLKQRLLEAALAYYQEFIEQRRDDPNAKAELEKTREGVKAILAILAVIHGAWQHHLLGEARVQDELQLSAEQRARIGEILQDIPRRGPPRDFDRPEESEQERSQRFYDEVKDHEAAIIAILTPAQLKRLRQIALQVQGATALLESDVVTALKLTPEQQEQVRAMARPFPFHEDGGPPPGPFPRESPRPAHMQRSDSDQEQIQAVLTNEQQKRWKEMIGEPFNGRLSPVLPGGPMRPHGFPKGPHGPHGRGG
jgi:serine/threonine protein kinase